MLLKGFSQFSIKIKVSFVTIIVKLKYIIGAEFI